MSTLISSLDFSIVVAGPVNDWRQRAISTYRQDLPDLTAAMRADLASRLYVLIGRTVKPEAVYVDASERAAIVVVDTIMFRLRHQGLVIVRPCNWCGSGEFESPLITHTTDIGYALSAWQPSHPQCQSEDPVNWFESSSGE